MTKDVWRMPLLPIAIGTGLGCGRLLLVAIKRKKAAIAAFLPSNKTYGYGEPCNVLSAKI